jgi:hypothetical protein
MGDIWRIAIVGSFNKFLGKVVTFLPNLLAMGTILIVGFVVAWIFKTGLRRFLIAIQFDKVTDGWGLTHILSKGGIRYSASSLLSRFFFWIIMLVTLILALNALEVAATQNFITQFFNHLPRFFIAIVILAVGYLIAVFLGQAALIAAVNAQMESARFLSRCVRWFLIVLSLTMAFYHLGIAGEVIITAFTITLGGIVLTLSIAFGWGGRELAKDFLERLYKRKGEKNRDSDHLSHL